MKFKKFSLKSEFSLALSTSTISTLVKMIAGVIINKVISVKIGPSGIALLGQFTNFSDIVNSISSTSFGIGVTKHIADPSVDNKKVIATSNISSLMLSLLICTVLFFNSKTLSHILFNSSDYSFIFRIFALSLPFFSLNSLLISVVNGYRDFKLLALLRISNSIIGLIISFILVWFFLIKGALIAMSINTSIVFFVSLLIILNKGRFNQYFNYKLNNYSKKILLKLLSFTFITIIISQLKPFVFLYLRNYIIKYAGIDDAGIWEATRRLSDYYNLVITTALSSYYLPKLASLNGKEEIKLEVKKGIKLILPIFLIVALLIFLSRNLIIDILFSSKFKQVSTLILPQLIGDGFMILSFMYANVLLAKSKLFHFLLIEVIFSFFRIILSIFLFNRYGIIGMIWSNTIIFMTYMLVLKFFFKKYLKSIN